MTLAISQAGRWQSVKPTWTEFITFSGYILAGIFALWVAWINSRANYGAKLIERVTAIETREQTVEDKLMTARSELLQARSDLLTAQREIDRLTAENADLVRRYDLLEEKYDLLQRNYKMQFPDCEDVIGLPPG